MAILYIIGGLPGSGKTHYLGELAADKKVAAYYDDYQKKAYGKDHDPRLSRHFGPLLSKLKRGQNMAVSDILFCQDGYLNLFLESILSVLPELEIELHFFENNPDKSTKNVTRRGRPKEIMDKELKFTAINSPNYKLPMIKRLKVYSPGKNQ
jgi:hypothetical protein